MLHPLAKRFLYTLVNLISSKSQQGWKNPNTTYKILRLQFHQGGISITTGIDSNSR